MSVELRTVHDLLGPNGRVETCPTECNGQEYFTGTRKDNNLKRHLYLDDDPERCRDPLEDEPLGADLAIVDNGVNAAGNAVPVNCFNQSSLKQWHDQGRSRFTHPSTGVELERPVKWDPLRAFLTERFPSVNFNLRPLHTISRLDFYVGESGEDGEDEGEDPLPLITVLPESIGQLTGLRRVDLSEHLLTYLPDTFGDLVSLQTLGLEGNQLIRLPESIGQLVNLRKLGLEGNQLISLPESIGQLVNLQHFVINGNQLTSLPASIGQLVNLQHLNLRGNQITDFPGSIVQLVHLTHLDALGNRLTSLPESFGDLINLQRLELDFNSLSSLPESIGQMVNLLHLGLDNNHLTSLPESIGDLSSLQELGIDNNWFNSLPVPGSIVRLKNLKFLAIDESLFEKDDTSLHTTLKENDVTINNSWL